MGINGIDDPDAKLAMYSAGQHHKPRKVWLHYVFWILGLAFPAIIVISVLYGLICDDGRL